MTTNSTTAIEVTKRLQEQQPDTQQQTERNGNIQQAAVTLLKVCNSEMIMTLKCET